ncbi:MAG: HEAT repeat domain-containing protein [Planctomycetes bacterium]|nr:HEAT repeat domain-containing protein [Planctomycetota bacterium]
MSEPNDAVRITLHFCALCNESIPQADVDSGRAQRRKDRWVCVSCERAMSASAAQTATAAAAGSSASAAGAASSDAPHAAATFGPAAGREFVAPAGGGAHANRGSSSGAAGVLVGTLALCVAIGGLAWWRWQRGEDQRADAARLATLVEESRRRDSDAERALGLERAAREALEHALLAAKGEAREAADAVRSAASEGTAKLASDLDGLRGTLASLDARLAAAVSKAELDALAGEAQSARDELSSLAKKLVELEERQLAAPAAVAVEAPAEPEQPTWYPAAQKLKSPDFSARWTAVQELGDSGDPAVVAYLVPVLLGDSDVFVRLAAARVLGDLGSLEAVEALITALGDEHSTVRENAYVSLRKLTKKDLPFDAQSDDVAERQRRIKAWQDWWKKAREGGSTP